MRIRWKEWVRSSPAYGMLRALKSRAGDRGARYDDELHEIMRRTLESDSCYVDIGANQGQLLRWAVRLAGRGTHYAFEPIPRLAADLRRRFPRVVTYEYALADYEGKSTFQVVEDAPAYSGLRRRQYDQEGHQITSIEVEVKTLDDVLGDQGSVALIKIDVEGGEFHVLLGARQLLLRARALVAFEAGWRSTGQYGVSAEQLYDFLNETCRYRVTTMQRWLAGLPPLTRESFHDSWAQESDYNFLAVPSERSPAPV